MKILDLFCGQGIVGRVLQEYGDLTGVDNVDFNKHYPGKFILSDWDDVDLAPYDFIWASPPCQKHSKCTRPFRDAGQEYPCFLKPVITKLENSGKPFVVENVPQAPFNRKTFMLCGQMFGLNLVRHRRFYTNFFVLCPPHPVHKFGVVYLYGNCAVNGDRKADWAGLMGVKDPENVTKKGLAQGIPANYTRYIMNQFMIWGDRDV